MSDDQPPTTTTTTPPPAASAPPVRAEALGHIRDRLEQLRAALDNDQLIAWVAGDPPSAADDSAHAYQYIDAAERRLDSALASLDPAREEALAKLIPHEVFHFLYLSFNVTLAWRLVAGRAVDGHLPPKHFQPSLGLIKIDQAHAMGPDIDPRVPLLVVRLGEKFGDLVIDGWHRIYRALHDEDLHVERLPVIVLTEREACIVARDGADAIFKRQVRERMHTCGLILFETRDANRPDIPSWFRAYKQPDDTPPITICPHCLRPITEDSAMPMPYHRNEDDWEYRDNADDRDMLDALDDEADEADEIDDDEE